MPQASLGHAADVLPGAIIVTTPHTLATKDAIKGINMFKTVGVNILGLVQNMAVLKCPHCHKETDVFGPKDRVQQLCAQMGIDFLGDIPLHTSISNAGDASTKPIIVSEPTSERSSAFFQMARNIAERIGLMAGLPSKQNIDGPNLGK